MDPINYLLFLTKPYSISVLEPFESAIRQMNAGRVKWFAAGSASNFTIQGEQLYTTKEVLAYKPDAIIVPGNVVPDFWPGLKVQMFHGLGEEKKGHYRVTGFFDVYCTPGPYMTENFQKLAKKKKTFLVRETGWPKLDKFSSIPDINIAKEKLGLNPNRPVLLYAPTFSPKYTSVPFLYEKIKELTKYNYQWLIKFHNLQIKEWQDKYAQITHEDIHFSKNDDILPLMQASDLMITDTSSVAYEFLFFDRPIITFRASTRLDKGLNIKEANELHGAIVRSLTDPNEFSKIRSYYLNELHPYSDGQSSQRLITAIQDIFKSGKHLSLKSKPKNWIRKRQIRKMIPK